MNQLPSNSDAKSIVYNQGYTEIVQKGVGFGLGFSVQLRNGNETGMRVSDGFGQYCTPMTYGWGGAAETVFWIDPQLQFGVVFMTQLLSNDRQKFDIRYELR
eukprot:CAMPEP_0114676388 /NCGR_PEP_ID=MMETSP0191-20121206/49166_1 /TAXON_ID=126664 /ORGANISM="Sorites sp." /LENGTH=101 /DNA_ID=CAMNT_0001947297 /DNA_START=202 /DNA_END=504 /DNA_ORIENTATION=-